MANDKERLRDLVRRGRLSSQEAAEIARSMEVLDERSEETQRSTGTRRRGGSPVGSLKARYLTGEIDREELDAGLRRVAWWMGGVYAALLGPGMTVFFILSMPGRDGPLANRALFLVPMSAFTLALGAAAGAAGGLFMYRVVLKPTGDKLSRLQEQVDLGTEPLVDTRPGQCPTCGAENKRTWRWSHPLVLHWMLNPGLVINEILLGQRCPAECHVCNECGTQFIDCATCNSSVDGLDWTVRDQFGRWSGMECVKCGGRIPCARNVFALALELPVRGVRRLFRPRPSARPRGERG